MQVVVFIALILRVVGVIAMAVLVAASDADDMAGID